MATYNGTNGDDAFVGTSSADTFNLNTLVLGADSVDGGSGLDTLILDYSSLSGGSYHTIAYSGGSFFGTIYGDQTNYLSFLNIEKLAITLGAGNDYLSVDASALATSGSVLNLKGGAGMDTLAIDYSALAGGTTFTVAANTAVTSNRGTYAQFEAYYMRMGAGTNSVTTIGGADTLYGGVGATNILKSGAGDDAIFSTGGKDTVDGGADRDHWYGDYSASITALAFTYNSGTGAGTLTGGTTLTGIEGVDFTGGSGNDTITLTGPANGTINGGDGVDTLTENDAGLSNLAYGINIYVKGAGAFAGQLGGYNTYFSGIEKLNVTFSDDDNYVNVDAAPLASGATLNLNGGVGNDRLAIDLSALSGTSFTVAANGAVTHNFAGLTLSNFEGYDLTLGNAASTVTTGAQDDTIRTGTGNDNVNGGAGNDSLYDSGGTNTLKGGAGDDAIFSTGGKDTVDGGADRDHWYGDYSASITALAFTYNSGTGAGTLTGGTTLTGIERVDFTGGSGNDTITLTGPSYGTIDGGDGIDTMTENDAGITGAGYYGNYIYAYGANGFSGHLANSDSYFSGIEKLNVTFSDDDDYVSVDASAIASGTTLNLNGGVGSDRLGINLSAFTGTTFAVASSGAITSNVTGLTLASFETFDLTLGNGANNVTTGANSDTIRSGSGNDTLNGGDGQDNLYDAGGTNTLRGGNGADEIHSTGGRDTVDGGADTDHWFGDYAASSTNLSFVYNGRTGAGTLTGGTTLTAIEMVDLTTGSGNDSFSITAGLVGSVDGGDGTDTLTVNLAGLATSYYYGDGYINANGSGGFSGRLTSYDNYFSNIEALNVTFSNDDNVVRVDGAPLAAGATLSLNGGVGADMLDISFQDAPAVTFATAANGTSTVAGGTFTGFETLRVTGSEAADSITGGNGNDLLDGRGGGDVLDGGAGDDVLYSHYGTQYGYGNDDGANVDTLRGGAGNDQIWGGFGDNLDGGADSDIVSIEASAYGSAVTADFAGIFTAAGMSLNGGTVKNFERYGYLTGSTQNDTLTIGDTAEDTSVYRHGLYGYDGNDTITAGAGDNGIYGGAGDDLIAPGAGDDYVDGGEGTDTVSYASATGGVLIEADYTYYGNYAYVTGAAGRDTLVNVEKYIGSAFDDIFTDGYYAADNVFIGGAGVDAVYYRSAQSGVTVNLALTGAQATGGGGTDILSGIENLGGGSYDDVLTGDSGANVLTGGLGNDVLDGAGGVDTADYDQPYGSVAVNLALTTQQDTGSAGLDTLRNIENLIGSRYDDTLAGSSGDNVITGGSGDDTINGAGGTDTAVYSGAWLNYDVTSANGTLTIADRRYTDGTDTVTNVEKFRLANGTFTAAQIVNVGPTAASDVVNGVVEGTSGTPGQPNASGNALGNDTDANLLTAGLGETLIVTAAYALDAQGGVIDGGSVQGATRLVGVYGALTIGPDGAFSYVLDNDDPDTDALSQGQAASDVFRYTVADAHGLTSTSDIVINIAGAGDNGAPPPPTVAGDSLYVTRGVGSSLDASVLLANVSGARGETLTVTGVGNATGGTVALVDGRLVVNASAASGGFDYTVSGSNGGAATGRVTFTSVATSSSANTVTAPSGVTAADLQGLGGADKLTGSAGNDHLVGGSSGDTLVGGAGIDTAEYSGAWVDYSVSVASGVTTITDLRSGSPDGADKVSGVELFRFTNGTFAAADIVNIGPSAANDDASVAEAGTGNTGYPDAYGNVLNNDSDPNLQTAGLGETLAVSGARKGELAAGGTLTSVAGATVILGSFGTLTIDPDGSYHYALDNTNPAVDALDPGQTATDVFTYAIRDVHGLTASAQLLITIQGADDQPLMVTAAADNLLVTTGLAASLDLAVLTANDDAPNGQTFSVTTIGNVTGGTVALANGRLAITLTGATGGFDYTITGSGGGTSTAHVSLTGVSTTTGNNTVAAASGYAAADLQGQAGNDVLTGTAGDDRLLGGAGNDTLTGGAGQDLLDGGAGNDIYVVDGTETIVEAEGTAGGTDTVRTALSSWTLGTNLENLGFTGTGGFSGFGNALANVITGGASGDHLVGADGNDTLTGSGGDDVLDGGAGNDKLDGGAGADQMTGGVGNDTYVVDDFGDTITEATGTVGGVDTVVTSLASYTLADVLENLTGTRAAGFAGTGNAFANVIVGGAGADTLTGLDGNDTLTSGAGTDMLDGGAGDDKLDGGTGADQMTGGVGNDTYVVDNVGDTVVEATGSAGGVDIVVTSLASYTLTNALENLTGTLSTGFTGTGNASANLVTGGAGADTLYGLDGSDTLSGGAGNDVLDGGVGDDKLDGGTGADQMTGGVGNDSYTVDNSGDVIVEASDASGGIDTVSTSLVAYTLAEGVENLSTTLKTAFAGTGNALANIITGGIANDVLSGLAGNDVLNGGTGDDRLLGGDDADRLTGSTGSDTMTGGSGADTFIFLKTTDFGPAGALDRITDFSSADGDRIDLAAIDPSSASGNQAFTFIGTGAFTTAAHSTFELRYQAQGDGYLLVQLDTTRDGVADYSFLVYANSLSASDFAL